MKDIPNGDARIVETGGDVEFFSLGDDPPENILEAVTAGVRSLDHCIEPPTMYFRVEGDDRWFVATVEVVIDLADLGALNGELTEANE